MRIIHHFILLAAFGFLQTAAQTPKNKPANLIGTWEERTSSLHEIKLISPTHVFFIVTNPANDSAFAAGAGTYRTTGDKYTEFLQHATFPVPDTGYGFDYKVEGDKMQQKGIMTMPDGSKIPINHTFTKVTAGKAFNGPHVGTWNQLSSTYQRAGGEKGSHTNATHMRYQLITPTHWMRYSAHNNKFENAFGGTYTLEGNKMICKMEYSSNPAFIGMTATMTQRVEGNKLYWSGRAVDKNGNEIVQFEDVFERVTGSAAKNSTASRRQ